jgi:hypothetical protein
MPPKVPFGSRPMNPRVSCAILLVLCFLVYLARPLPPPPSSVRSTLPGGSTSPKDLVRTSQAPVEPEEPEATARADQSWGGGKLKTLGTPDVEGSGAAIRSQCDLSHWTQGATLVGNRPVGTYLCEYFPQAEKFNGGCKLQCPSARASALYTDAAVPVPCALFDKASPQQLQTADIVVNHHGPVPQCYRAEQITVFYSGESNYSEGKKAKPEYQAQYAEVVSFHSFRRFRFTWTHRFLEDFTSIASGSKSFPPPKLNAIVVFVSRCGKGGRDGIIKRLMNTYTVHSFGKCARTHQVAELHPECLSPNNRYKEKLCVFSKYQFALTLDNTREEDYVTEKVYHALISGPVPIYDGAPNVNDYIPTPQSVLRLGDFMSAGSGGSQAVNRAKTE